MKLLNAILSTTVLAFAAHSAAAAQEKTVTLYTSNPEQAILAYSDVLHTQNPDITLNSVTGGSAVLLRRIEAESAQTQADIFWSSSYNTIRAYEKFFSAYASPALATIPKELRYPGDLFVPANVHISLLMVNTSQLGKLAMPKTWEDLLAPEWKGKFVVADPANSSTGYTILWGIYKKLGAEGLEKLAANAVVSSSSSAVQSGVAMGEYAVGLAFEANAYPYVDGGQKEIKLIYPEDGTFMTADYAGLIKNAPGQAASEAAFDTLLSQEVQIALLKDAFRRPSRTDIQVSKYVDLPEMSSINIFRTDEKEAADNREEFLTLWQAAVTAAGK